MDMDPARCEMWKIRSRVRVCGCVCNVNQHIYNKIYHI